jgi:archaellum biogenesis protein FlaJ (TadC family)
VRGGEDRDAVRDGGTDVAGGAGSTDGGGREPRATAPAGGAGDGPGALATPDRVCYALFSRHADRPRHRRDRRNYRGADLRTGFDVLLARTYGLSWLVAAIAVVAATGVGYAVVAPALAAGLGRIAGTIPLLGGLPAIPRPALAVGTGLLAGGIAKRGSIRALGTYLRWRASARRTNIEGTLPGAVRYLHVLASGSDAPRSMLRRVAATDAYGETAVAFRRVLNTAALAGSLADGIRRVARDTPSRDLLAPFLLKFREHADQGERELATYLRMESRMLGHRQDRARDRAEGFLELLAEVFMVLLVLPALLVIVLTVMATIAPGLSSQVTTPLGTTSTRGIVVYASAAFVVGTGAGASVVVEGLRPPGQAVVYERPAGVLATVASAARNPASAAVALLVPAAVLAGVLAALGVGVTGVVLAGYAAYAIPVGVVAVRRARRDDAKDRELKDFVHAVSGHVNLGRPFSEAVELVAQDVDLGPLDEDVADLALNLRLTTRESGDETRDLRAAALDRFVDRVGTPLAEQTVGLVAGALDAGSDAGTVFDTLQTEVGRLYHEKRALRSNMLVYVAVGWTTALLVIGITVAVGMRVFDGFSQLAALSESTGYVLGASTLDLDRARFRLYVVTQATMLGSGWFAGTASRGRYEALLHSGVLVVVCHLVFAGVGMI